MRREPPLFKDEAPPANDREHPLVEKLNGNQMHNKLFRQRGKKFDSLLGKMPSMRAFSYNYTNWHVSGN